MSVGLRNDIRPVLNETCEFCQMRSWCGRMCANMDAVNEAMGFKKKPEVQTTEVKHSRACKSCGADIAHLHHWAKYCEEHKL